MSMKWDGPKVVAKVQAAQRRALAQAAEMMLAKSQQVVPVDEGQLLRSGTVDVQGDMATISYDTPYALYQHEGMYPDGSHKVRRHKKASATTKYLERPFEENKPAALKYIERASKAVM